MLASIVLSMFVGGAGFIIGMIVGSEQSHTVAVNTLEQKIGLLERENETLQEANEEWSDEYEKLSKDHSEKLARDNAPDSLCIPVILVLAGMVVANAISIYISLLMKAKLQ